MVFLDFVRIGNLLYGEEAVCMLCGDERVKLVEDLSKVEMEDGSVLTDADIPNEKRLPPNFKTALIRGAKSGSPLTEMTWLKTITLLVENTLQKFNFVTNLLSSESAQSEIEELTDTAISNNGKAFFFKALLEGPSGLNINVDCLTVKESPTDFGKYSERYGGNFPSARKYGSIFVTAIGLIGYWQRKGIELDCPFAKLLATLADIGFFSLVPMFNTSPLERVRPILKECKERYGTAEWFKEFLDMILFKDNNDDETNIRAISASVGLFFTMSKEEWFISETAPELDNAEAD